jgi:hypothetical protein
MKLVRIHPYEPRRGHTTLRYSMAGSGYPMFMEGRGWYEVDDDIADKLGELTNNPNDPRSPLVFQVLTKEEAQAIDMVEKQQIAVAESPIPMPKSIRNKIEEESNPDLTTEEVAPKPRKRKKKTIKKTSPKD